MKKLLTAVIAASMLVPSTVLASSIRPGSRHSIKPSAPRSPVCKGEDEKFTEKCEITVDETGVKAQDWHITDVVQWSTEEKPFNVGGAIVGGAAGAGVGFAAGLGSCAIIGPFCLLTAPAIMQTGAGVGAGAGGTARGKFFTVVGDDAKGNRLIQEFWIPSDKKVKELSKDLLNTTKLVEGETR
jgi:hypothetical protein